MRPLSTRTIALSLLRRTFSTTSSSTTKSLTDPALEWGRQNPQVAEKCMAIPPISDNIHVPNNHHHHLESFEDYWNWRQWDFSAASSPEEREYAQALVSHMLSAPLTVAKFLLERTSANKHPRWCCVGARAEATLPLGFWKELLVATTTTTMTDEPLDLSIDFVGPEIYPPKSIPPQTLTHGDHQLSLNWIYQGFLHDYINNGDIPNWSGFVLLNPGLGHPHLQEGWKPTLDYLLLGARLPLLLTAHSELDATRDAHFLQNDYNLQVVPSPNPFCSRIQYQDPFDPTHVVQPNHSILAIIEF